MADDTVKHIEPELFGMAPYQVVAVAMLLLILIMVWKKVPALVTGGLDGRIAAIREQLDEAKALRAEAEALRAEYAAKIAGAEQDAAAMMDNARREADTLLAKAEADSAAMVERRKAMAESKIAGAEREAIAEVRARAAEAAAQASRTVIADKYDAAADRSVADEVIAAI
ncbi:MAG: hypothetical protein WA954_03610 [Parerythrobacter sp.]